MNARTTALSALIACRRQGAWSDGALKEYIARDRLDKRDAAFAAQLCYGVMQNRMLLDFYIEHQLTGRLSDLQPVVLEILRLGAYQIVFLDKVPASAAVNEAVEQCKKYANKRASGLVNGVLRSLARSLDSLPQPPDPATKYSHPAELVALLRENVPQGLLEAVLAADNQSPRTQIQINPLLVSEAEVLAELDELGIAQEPHPWLPGCFLVSGTGSLENLELFRQGKVYVQDAAAHLAAQASGVQPGMTVLDCCAAPGGKSFAAAMQMENIGRILSCDLHSHKTALIEKGAARLGITIIEAMEADASKHRSEWDQAFDTVIADVPCSGLGVIRKKPDIRYKDLKQTEGLPAVQRAILESVSGCVKPGGVLVYSTCTILKRENEEIVSAFLEAHPEYALEKIPLPEKLTAENSGMLTLYPGVQETDGFFIAKLRRQA